MLPPDIQDLQEQLDAAERDARDLAAGLSEASPRTSGAIWRRHGKLYCRPMEGRMRFSRRERGEGQLGCIVGLIVLAIAIFVAYKMIPVKVKAAELRQVVVDEAKSAGTHTNERIRAEILRKAQENQLPVTEDNIQISRGGGEITVDVNYTVPIEFPGFTYKWHLKHHANNPIF